MCAGQSFSRQQQRFSREQKGLSREQKAAALALIGVVLAGPAWAGDSTPNVDPGNVDTSHWSCRFCPSPSGLKGSVTAGPGYVSSDSAKFGQFNDLNQQGGFLSLDSQLTYFGQAGQRWDLNARNLGLDTRLVDLSGGVQGKYKVDLGFNEMVDHESDSALTPFLGAGGDNLTLPGNWQRGQTTQGMTELNTDLQTTDIGTKRQQLWAGIRVPATNHWRYSVAFHHEHRDGTQVTGAAFLNTSTLLPRPVDYNTDRIDAGVGYQTDDWQLRLKYMGSFFRDDYTTLSWDNPFTAITPGSDRGVMSLPPDNEFNQLDLSGFYRFDRRATFAGNLAWGRMTQNDNFGPSTLNGQIISPVLPRQSANIKVNTLNANGRLMYLPPIRRLSLTWDFSVDKRDNNTPIETYRQVVADSFVGPLVSNQPLSYGRYRTGLRANYDFSSGRRLSGGVKFENFQRQYGNDPRTNETTGWAEFRTPVTEKASLDLKVSHGQRNGTNEAATSPDFSPENPLLTWYDIADRTRNKFHGALDINPVSRVSISLIGERTLDDYGNTQIGRTQMGQDSYTVDLSFSPADSSTLFAYLTRQSDDTKQNNSQNFSRPDWSGTTSDTSYTSGLGGRIKGIAGKIDLDGDLSYTHSRGVTRVSTTTSAPGFPDFTVAEYTARLHGGYQWSAHLRFGMTVLYEYFNSRDWQTNGVLPDTIPQLLALGEQSPSYHVTVALATVTYKL